MMLTRRDLEAIRAIVREEIDRALGGAQRLQAEMPSPPQTVSSGLAKVIDIATGRERKAA